MTSTASASLFGEWSANVVPFEPLPTDPNLRNALIESDAAGGEAWPGATLPDITQLTAVGAFIPIVPFLAMEFGTAGALVGSGGCNNYTTAYRVNGSNITIDPPAAWNWST